MQGPIGRRQKQILKLLEENGAMTVAEIVGKVAGWWEVGGFDYKRMHSLEKRGLVVRLDDKVQTFDLAE